MILPGELALWIEYDTSILMMSWLSLCMGHKLGKPEWCPGWSMLASSLVLRIMRMYHWIQATEREPDLRPIFAALRWRTITEGVFIIPHCSHGHSIFEKTRQQHFDAKSGHLLTFIHDSTLLRAEEEEDCCKLFKALTHIDC